MFRAHGIAKLAIKSQAEATIAARDDTQSRSVPRKRARGASAEKKEKKEAKGRGGPNSSSRPLVMSGRSGHEAELT